MKTITVGFLGCGGIGSGVWNLLQERAADIAVREGITVDVKRILVRDPSKARDAAIPSDRFTTDPADLLDDPEISVILEFLGGEQPALTYLCRALTAGKTVVTANKMAVALGWHELFTAAEASGAGLYFEAAVCGAVPIIRTLLSSLQGNRVNTLMGIVNGTTNYILSRMTDSGCSFADGLADAQRLGLAEPDPTSDVDAWDAVYKLSVLASLAFHTRMPHAIIYREGIREVASFDVDFAKTLGYTVKLLAIAKERHGTFDVRVHPALLPSRHPLAGVYGAFNAVFVRGSAAGDLMLYGQGAGSQPTAPLSVIFYMRPASPRIACQTSLRTRNLRQACTWKKTGHAPIICVLKRSIDRVFSGTLRPVSASMMSALSRSSSGTRKETAACRS